VSEQIKAALVDLLREKTSGEIGSHLLSQEPKEWIDKASILLGDRGEGWLDEVLDAGEDLVDAEADGEYAKAGAEAITLLRENKQPFLRMGDVTLAWVAANFDDDQEEAKRVYMATRATYAERRAYKHALTDHLIDWTAEASDAWDAVADVLGKIGNIGLRLITKAALGTIGLA